MVTGGMTSDTNTFRPVPTIHRPPSLGAPAEFLPPTLTPCPASLTSPTGKGIKLLRPQPLGASAASGAAVFTAALPTDVRALAPPSSEPSAAGRGAFLGDGAPPPRAAAEAVPRVEGDTAALLRVPGAPTPEGTPPMEQQAHPPQQQQQLQQQRTQEQEQEREQPAQEQQEQQGQPGAECLLQPLASGALRAVRTLRPERPQTSGPAAGLLRLPSPPPAPHFPHHPYPCSASPRRPVSSGPPAPARRLGLDVRTPATHVPACSSQPFSLLDAGRGGATHAHAPSVRPLGCGTGGLGWCRGGLEEVTYRAARGTAAAGGAGPSAGLRLLRVGPPGDEESGGKAQGPGAVGDSGQAGGQVENGCARRQAGQPRGAGVGAQGACTVCACPHTRAASRSTVGSFWLRLSLTAHTHPACCAGCASIHGGLSSAPCPIS